MTFPPTGRRNRIQLHLYRLALVSSVLIAGTGSLVTADTSSRGLVRGSMTVRLAAATPKLTPKEMRRVLRPVTTGYPDWADTLRHASSIAPIVLTDEGGTEHSIHIALFRTGRFKLKAIVVYDLKCHPSYGSNNCREGGLGAGDVAIARVSRVVANEPPSFIRVRLRGGDEPSTATVAIRVALGAGATRIIAARGSSGS
jgi:hypothetical protein